MVLSFGVSCFCGNSSACREKGNAADDDDDDDDDDGGYDDDKDGDDVLDWRFCSQAD